MDPPGSGNGGYTCGITAAALGAGPVEVTLRVPPPLGRPLVLEVADGEARLLDGDTVVAIARPTTAPVDAGPEVTLADARAAIARFDEAGYHAAHPFAGCFTCGPARAAGDGLRIFPAPIADPGVVVWTWTPAAPGPVPTEFVWAALDCPGGQAWIHADDVGAAVLGRLAVRVERAPVPGEELIVVGWRAGRDADASPRVRRCAPPPASWSPRRAPRGSSSRPSRRPRSAPRPEPPPVIAP